jgi:hypothetical protein
VQLGVEGGRVEGRDGPRLEYTRGGGMQALKGGGYGETCKEYREGRGGQQ